jgi:hypothetical protein
MQSPHLPSEPERRRRPTFGQRGARGADLSPLMPRPWPGGPQESSGNYNMPDPGPVASGAFPVSGAPAQRRSASRPPGRRTFGRVPSTRMSRTDPTMYAWDRLSPEQQQAVLDTIKAAGIRRGDLLLDRRVLGAVLAAALVILFLLLALR